MCDTKNHELIVIYENPMMGCSHVVRWCEDCGAVVTDIDCDGRTKPGAVMKMHFPKRVYNEQKDNSI